MLVVDVRLFVNKFVVATLPNLNRPFAFTENCDCRTPTNQKSNPMLNTADGSSSRLAARSCVVPLDISSSETLVELVKGYVVALIVCAKTFTLDIMQKTATMMHVNVC